MMTRSAALTILLMKWMAGVHESSVSDGHNHNEMWFPVHGHERVNEAVNPSARVTSPFLLVGNRRPAPEGSWIGGLQLSNGRTLAILLDLSKPQAHLTVWLRTGEPRVFDLLASRFEGSSFTLRGGKADDVCTGTFHDAAIQGECQLASDNIKGVLQLVRVGSDIAARSRYNGLWQRNFLGPESYLYLATNAAQNRNLTEALLWLERGRRAKSPMSTALLFSGADLTEVRREPRFRAMLQDPVAAHPELSQATYAIRIDRGVRIPMRDGARLLADIYRPDSPGRFPVILIRGPYGRGADVPPGGVDHFATRGYVVVIQAVRGTDGSEGEFEPWLNERKDGYDTIDWVSRQAWSTGRVGMMGLSYLGQSQWAAAVEAHPALKAIIPEVSGTDHMLDVPYDHGIFRLDFLSWIRGNTMPRPRGQFSRPALNDEVLTSLPMSTLDGIYTGQTSPIWQRLLEMNKASDWSSANFLADLMKVHIPVLHISGWWDGEANATTINYTAMRALGRDNQWLIYGPWAHVWNESTRFRDQEYGPTAMIDFQSLSVRWFDQWLKEKKVQFEATPKVQVFVTGANQWRNLADWPDPSAHPLSMFLGGGGGSCARTILAQSQPVTCSSYHDYRYDPAALNPLAPEMIPATTTAMKLDLAAKDMLVFESDPFETPVTVTGPAYLDLWFSTSAHDVDFFVVAFDRDPSGVARALSGPGKVRMRYIDGWDSPHPLTPDTIYHGRVDLRPFAHRIAKGHRLGIAIRSDWFPGYERNLGTGEPIKNAVRMEVGTQRIFHDTAHPSALKAWVLESEPVSAELDHFPALIDSAGIPGMSMAFLRDGEIAWTKGFGVRSVTDSARVDQNTVFEAASLSKPVVAYVSLKLVDAGLLNLDRPLREYITIPELADGRASRLTGRMVLSHTTGLQNERIGQEPLALAFEPGERFRYSGEGFVLLQRALESITGESLDALSRRLVFDPLGMTRSGFTWRANFADNAASGHGDFKSPRTPSRPIVARAPSSLQTTAHDYALFVRAILHRNGLQDQTFHQMTTPQVTVVPGIAWGLGWSLEIPDSVRTLWHWGENSNSGFTSFVLADPVQRSAVVYFANSGTGLGIVRRVLALMGGSHAAPAFMGYEPYDAPSRKVRLSIEEDIRTADAAAGLRTYDRLKSQFDSSAFGEALLNTLGYRFLALNRATDAVTLFHRNVQEFPRSSNAFDSLGDGLVALGRKDDAIASYLRSYELDPRNEHALGEVKRLRANR
jgi:putative CocE/NonD family hydrolase